FRDRAAVLVALSLDALERDPDAEIAVLGSPFLAQLLEAVRARSGRLSLGMIPPRTNPGRKPGVTAPKTPGFRPGSAKSSGLVVPVRNGTAKRRKSVLATHTIGRLLARIVLRAGAAVEEVLIESAVIDLATGAIADNQVSAVFADLEAQRIAPADPDDVPDAKLVPAREPAEMLQLLLGDLREKTAERVAARQAAAEKEVAAELERLDRYFASVLADKTDPDEVRTITGLHERRRAEEMRRHQVKAIVHPLQLVDAQVLMQRVEWDIQSTGGVRVRFAAQRPFAGSAAWILSCPKCGKPPAELVVCVHEEDKGGHCGCDACSKTCAVCSADFCADHGIASCRVDEKPACEQHARVCQSCRMAHCSTHEGTCAEGEHPACTACLEACGSCGRIVCNQHAERTRPDAPKGSRRLCPACVRHCEGGTNEPVGVDEVVQCVSCGRSVCTAHQAICAVDGRVHCSRHLRRVDGSGRFVCEQHRATCVAEPEAVFASDEVSSCATCGMHVCAPHSAECVAEGDQARHCLTHLVKLADVEGSLACAAHRRACHVDGGVFSVQGVEACPVCGKDVCSQHRASCSYCGRQVCTVDLERKSGRCATCARLEAAEPPQDVIAAALTARPGARSRDGREPGGKRSWRMARDRTHVVLELTLGWRRKTVFSLRHGAAEPDRVVTH
ncbi:MAG TPA: hypothetical protein VKD28_07330, partial [Gemmatimonadales bacterium]|nr:hypothetical protein [Gemmatimonadales bacterium]